MLLAGAMSPLDEAFRPVARDDEHAARTVRAIRAALRDVPFYAKQGLASPEEDTPLESALAALPLLTRARIRPTLPKVWLPEGRDAKAELASGKLAVVEVGTGEGRARVLFDAAWSRAQEARALSAHPRAAAALEQGPYRDAVLWVPERGTGSCGSGDPAYEERLEGGRLHLNSRQDPTFWTELVMTRMLDELARHAPAALLADPFYLDVLARHAASLGRRLDVRGFVALMRARATSAHRAALAEAVDAPVFDVLSARETGPLFVEAEDGRLHHVPSSTHVELLAAKVPTPGASDVALVVVTTLDRSVQPLVRYVLGDLVQVDHASAPRFTTVRPIRSVEGRFEDAIVRPDGALVTAGALDRALAPLGLRAFQATQLHAESLDLEVVGGSADAARDALAPLLEGLRVNARATTAIAAEANGKYRVTRRRHPVALASCFAGCEAETQGVAS